MFGEKTWLKKKCVSSEEKVLGIQINTVIFLLTVGLRNYFLFMIKSLVKSLWLCIVVFKPFCIVQGF